MDENLDGPPRSFPIKCLKQLRNRSYFRSAHFEFNKSSVPLQKEGGTSREKRPRLLGCHDLSGNYLDDQWIQGASGQTAYTLTHWRLLDSFVYFSHELVTLPPPCWTNAGHKHGVQVLGTFITEWAAGVEICKVLLESKESSRMYADRLAELAMELGFDGWLINIENKIEKDQVANLQEFVRHLTVRMHSLVPGSLVIWYDSVTMDGNLDWQNRLTKRNKPFFDACDAIFTNYTWREDYPELSAAAAGAERAFDVYMGVDVFGRGSFGGGQYACDVALNTARKAGVSAALFAPAWSYEMKEDQSKWWGTIENCWPAARPDPVQLPFFTDFDIGHGIAKCMEAKRVWDLPWNNVSCQNLQPRLHVAVAATEDQLGFTTTQEIAVYSGGVCIKAVGDLAPDEICIVQLYHTETIIEEASLNISYSVTSQTDSNFSLALSVEDGKGSKVIFFLLDSKDADIQSLPGNHHFKYVSAVFQYVVERHDSITTGASSSSEGDSSLSSEFLKLCASGGNEWTVRDFVLEWGNYKLVDIFGICSAAKDLQPILIKLLHENETLFDGESFVKQARTTEASQFSMGQSTMPPVEKPSLGKDSNVVNYAQLGHISVTPGDHEHSSSTDSEFSGYDPSWVRDGESRYLSIKLRWELLKNTSRSGTWTSCTYHILVTLDNSEDNSSYPMPMRYLGTTMLGSYYIDMLPLWKSSCSVTFSLLSQCPCGKLLRTSIRTFTLPVPFHEESGRYVMKKPTLSDWLFRELK